VYGVLVELVGFACPLTALQNYLLRRGGQAGYHSGAVREAIEADDAAYRARLTAQSAG
jgi:uncharacterized protein DUF2784